MAHFISSMKINIDGIDFKNIKLYKKSYEDIFLLHLI